MTRLRYDPNPFDTNGFDLTTAATNVVWGMERRELELTETISFHDRRVKRNLHTFDPMTYNPRDRDLDGEFVDDEADNDGMPPVESDSTLDQFRIPEASSIVEIRSLRSPQTQTGTIHSGELSCGALRFHGNRSASGPWSHGGDPGNTQSESPVWRLAVGYTDRDGSPNSAHRRSALWVNEAERMSTLTAGPGQIADPLNGLTGANADHNPGDANSTWSQRIRHVSEVASPVDPTGTFIQDNQVYLYDDDLDPTTLPPEVINLERFVWFTPLTPNSNGGLNVTNPASNSGMRADNVFFLSGVYNNVTNAYQNVPALLEGGQYAVVLPRTKTILGSTRESTAALNWPYKPSLQKIEFFIDPNNNASRQLRYFDLGTGTLPPPDDWGGTPIQAPSTNYRTRNVLPIVAQCLSPGLADPAGGPVVQEWSDYLNLPGAPTVIPTIPPEDLVGVGFNISAPLSGRNYYKAPRYYINSGGDQSDGEV